MNDKVYNRCLKIARLGCESVRRGLAVANNIQNQDVISVKVKGRDKLVEYVEKIMKHSTNALAVYRSRVHSLLVVESDDKRLVKTAIAGELFIKSVLKSRESRMCQKQLVDLISAEIYFQEAALYDRRYPYKQIADSAIEYAKHVVLRLQPSAFMKYFQFDSKPHIDENVYKTLVTQAFDKRYALGTMENIKELANKKYESDYVSRKDFFVETNRKTGVSVSDTRLIEAKRTITSVKDRVFTPESLIIADLYKGAFANLSSQNKIRRFVNLKARNSDIDICPIRNLSAKRQFATIDAMTMHRYIYDFYTDHKPANIMSKDLPIYYFKQELGMYRNMWGEDANVIYKNGKLYFGDGSSVAVPDDVAPHEGLHRVNAAYGALFGFTPDDMKGDWLSDSVRQAYTSEGMAEYRLAMIDARMKGKA